MASTTRPDRKYQLVVIDIDGTLLDDDRLVTPEVHAAVDLARGAGVRLSLATGRAFDSARQIAAEVRIAEPIISDGGAVVGPAGTGARLRDLRIAPATAGDILAAVAAEEADCHVFYRHDVRVNRLSSSVRRYASRLGIEMGHLADLAADARRRPEGPTMIVLRSNRYHAPVLRARYGARFGHAVQVTSTAPHFVDFLHHDASKAKALDFLCTTLGIPPDRVIAIGDGINDLDMIAHAGLGVLVANAARELWPHADYVTEAPYYEGIAEVIQRFCLK